MIYIRWLLGGVGGGWHQQRPFVWYDVCVKADSVQEDEEIGSSHGREYCVSVVIRAEGGEVRVNYGAK